MATLKTPRKTTASVVALAVLVATPVGIAVAHPGFPTADVDLYQRAVWVTNEATGLVGLVNRQIRELTASIPVSADLDVLQWADTVVAHDQQGDTAGLIDAAVQRVPAQAGVQPGSTLALGESTLSVLDPVGGSLWTIPAESGLEGELAAEQAVDVGRDALAVVSTDGTVFVASPEQSALLKISGPGAQPERVGDLPEGELALTAVGDRLVVASTSGSGSRITVVGGGSTEIPDGVVRLQQPGPEAEFVIVATSDGLLRLPLAGGGPVELHSPTGAAAAAPIEIAAPVVIVDDDGTCIYAAWASAAEFVRQCGGREAEVEALRGATSADELVFRVNRGSVVLNNVGSGVVYLVQDEMTIIEADDWLAVAPPEEDDEAPESDESTTQPTFDEILAERPETNTPPEASNDDFGIRGDRTTVLPVLENDLDLDGDVLTIASVTGLSPDVATLDIIDGGRALQITPVSNDAVTRTFGYTVTDGREGGIAQAVVTVTVAPAEQNRAPAAQRISQLSLEAGGTITYNVLADWRDPDGDDLYLTSAASTAGDLVRFSPDGLVTLTHSGTEPGERTLVFSVSDGSLEAGQQPAGELRVSIEPSGTLPPLTVPDFGQAFVGQGVVIDPLQNDVARSSRSMSLISVEPLSQGASWSPLSASNSSEYRFAAGAPGIYYFIYVASTGAGQESSGVLRLDVVPDPDEPLPPIAVKDTAFLRPGEPLTVPVLLNDVSPSGAVLGIQSVDVPTVWDAQGLTVEVLGGAMLRLSTTNVLPMPVSVSYTISDGVRSSTSSVAVVPIDPLSKHQAPIARDDRITVRAGDVASVNVMGNDLHPDGAVMSLNPDLVQGFDGNDGVAFVEGNLLRLQAPADPGSYVLVYRVEDAYAEYATARVQITVTEENSDSNAAPVPPTVTGRVQAGSELTVDIPTSGVDVDGDSVMLLSATGASLGQIVTTGLSSFQYRAARESGGTEVIRYTVQDAYGARGEGEVRIGVIPPPESPLPPVAVDDSAEVQPGNTVIVQVIANDSDPAGSSLELDPDLFEIDGSISAEVVDGGRLIAVTAGEEEGFFTLRYRIANTQGGVDDAFVKVTVTPDARPQPPVAVDKVLTITEILKLDEIEVNLLQGAVNPDGDVEELEATIVGPGAATVTEPVGGVATITLTERRQSIAFTLTSPLTGLSATAFVIVPAATSAEPPFLKPEVSNNPPALAVNQMTPLRIRELIEVPSGGELVIVGDAVDSATAGLELVTEVTETELRVTPTEEQRGSAQSITVIVTDGITDTQGGTAITIPVVVGDPESRDIAPIFTPFEVLIEADGSTTERDLRASTSHPSDAIIDSMSYDATVSGAEGQIDVLVANGTLSATAALGGAQPGDEMIVDLTLRSDELLTEPTTARVTVRVVSSTRPLAQAIDDIEPDGRSNSSYTIAPLANDFNPFAAIGGELAIVDTFIEGDALGASVSNSAESVNVTTGPAKSGTVTVVYTVQDASNEESRQVQGRITVIVASAPEPPTLVELTREGSESIGVRFSAPVSSNGADITGYVVQVQGGGSPTTAQRSNCLPGPVCIFTARTNGALQTVTVAATNRVGTTWSNSANITPYAAPSPPLSVRIDANRDYADATIYPRWSQPAATGGGNLTYEWNYTSGASGSGSTGAFEGQSRVVGQGSYAFQVRACNPGGCSGYVAASRTIDAPPPVPQTMTIARNASTGWITLTVAGFAPNRTMSVQCWVMPGANGQGGYSIGSFSVTTDASGGGTWGNPNTCYLLGGGYGNLKVGPNETWSNTVPLS